MALAARLGEVVEKAAALGLRPILISLTLDRKRWPDGPLSAWGRLRELRAVARSVKAFCRHYGVPYAHRYVAKMELQKAGWPHWHVLLLVPSSLQLPQIGAMDDFWRWGFSNVRHDSGCYEYLCKYAAKEAGQEGEEALEASGLPARAVHWVMPSRGFWSHWGLAEWRDEEAAIVHDDEAVCEERIPGETHAARVARCKRVSELTLEVGAVTVYRGVLPMSRSELAARLGIAAGEDRCECYESGVVRSVELTAGDAYDLLAMCAGLDEADAFWSRLARMFRAHSAAAPPTTAFSPMSEGSQVSETAPRAMAYDERDG